MNLVVFDLDGTLTQTFAIDEQCFLRAFRDGLGIDDVDRNWSVYEHVTDSGVVDQVCRDRLGRDPAPTDVRKFVNCFVSLLERRYAESTDAFGQTPGAAKLLELLRQQSQWAVAVATGGFEQSARFKMQAAGLAIADLPAAFAEDGPAREAIVQAAVMRAASRYRRSHFDRIVSVGDAVWDVRTARRLGLPFVGVAMDAKGGPDAGSRDKSRRQRLHR
jgi:phosphoglycolate phosphatase-like HAD superfamily hydrolase